VSNNLDLGSICRIQGAQAGIPPAFCNAIGLKPQKSIEEARPACGRRGESAGQLGDLGRGVDPAGAGGIGWGCALAGWRPVCTARVRLRHDG